MLDGRPSWRIVYALCLGVTGAATDSRQTSGAAGHAARTRELTAGATSDARDTALPARTPAGPAVLAAGAAVAVGVTAAPARVLLEDRMRWCAHRRTSHVRFRCRHRSNSNRCSNGTANYEWFHQV
jgi:hypothetical protein